MEDIISNHFTESGYNILLSHGICSDNYELVEDDEYPVNRDTMIALYKLYLNSGEESEFDDYQFDFGDDFGYFEDDDIEEFREWEENLSEESIALSKTEKKLIIEFFDNVLEGISEFEADECGYPDDCEDETIYEAIENNDFFIQFNTIME